VLKVKHNNRDSHNKKESLSNKINNSKVETKVETNKATFKKEQKVVRIDF